MRWLTFCFPTDVKAFKKLLGFILLSLSMAAIGFFASWYLIQPGKTGLPAEEIEKPTAEMLFKMPLGNLVIQVMQPDSILHIVLTLDVYISGAKTFESMNGAKGRARLRDAATIAVSELAETTLWVEEGQESDITSDDLARQIAHRMSRKYKAIKAARVEEFVYIRNPKAGSVSQSSADH